MTLVRKLAKIGKSWGLILPREALEAAEIDPAATLALRVDPGKIVLSRLDGDDSDPFEPLRRRIPRKLTDKQVGKILEQSLRRVRHAVSTPRSYR